MATEEGIGFPVQDTSREPTSSEMDSGCEMRTKDNIGFPVQETSRESTSSEMDSGVVPFCIAGFLSIKETRPPASCKSHGSKATHSGENSAISADNFKYENDAIDKTRERNRDITLGGNCDTADSGGDRQDNMELSCFNSKASEDTSMRLDDITVSCAPENSAPIQPVSGDGTSVGLEENNLAPEGHRSISIETELLEPECNGDAGSRSSDDGFVYHEVNKDLSASQTDGNASNLKTNDSTNKDTSSTTTYSKLQDGADMDKNKDKEQEKKTSTDHGRDNIDFLNCGLNINKEKSKAFDETSPNEKSSTDPQQDNNVRRSITSGDPNTLTLTSVNSTATGLDDDNISLEIHESTNIANELPEAEYNSAVGSRPSDDMLAHHEVNNDISVANQTVGYVSNIKTDVHSDKDAYSTTTYSKQQGGANLTKDEDSENKTSTDHRENNVDFSCNGPNIKEGKSKDFNGTRPNDNSSTGLQQDNSVLKVLKSDVHITMDFKSENRSTKVLEDKSAPDGHRSNNIATEFLQPKHNSDMSSRSSDDIVAQHEVNNGFSLGTQTDASINYGCNQSTNSFKTDEDTHVDAHPRRKRSKIKSSDNKLSKDHNPKYKLSSGYGRDKKGLSIRRLNNQDQTPAIIISPNAFTPTSPTYSQQDGEVSVGNNLDDPFSLPCGAEIRSPRETKMDKRNDSGIFSMVYKMIGILLMIVLLVAPVPAQATSEWQFHYFNTTNRNISYQSLIFMNMKNRNSPNCTLNFTSPPFWYNCSQSGILVFVYNETRVEMATADLSAEHYSLDYGNSWNGYTLQSTPGGTIDDKSLEDKIAEITKLTGSTTQPGTTEDTKPTVSTPQTLGDTDPTVWIIIGVTVPLVAFIVLVSLYRFCQSFRRWVQSFLSLCRGRNTNKVPEKDAGSNLEMKPLAFPTTNGIVNGHLGNEV